MSSARSVRAILLAVALSVCTLATMASDAAPPTGDAEQLSPDSPEYWHRRRHEFYQKTAFDLNDFNLNLIGRKRTIFENEASMPRGHLPFWFDYELFKRVFNKPQPVDPAEELARHHVYISACMRAIKLRTLFRMLAGTKDTLITSDADQFYWEKFGQLPGPQASESVDGQIAFVANMKFEFGEFGNEQPLDRAIRLMRAEMDTVESKNQVETYLKAFNEYDGSAIDGKLPY